MISSVVYIFEICFLARLNETDGIHAFPCLLNLFFCITDKCEFKVSLSGSNAGITSVEFDNAVSMDVSFLQIYSALLH